MIRRYFVESRGSAIKGFETESAQDTNSSAGKHGRILLQKLPGCVVQVLERKLPKQGFGLEDAVTMAVILERLVFDAELGTLERAFELNDHSPVAGSEDHFKTVRRSYSLMYTGQVAPGAKWDHVRAVESVAADAEIRRERVGNHSYSFQVFAEWEVAHAADKKRKQNPFTAEVDLSLSFVEASDEAERVGKDFGSFQNQECSMLRSGLKGMDKAGTGRGGP